MAGSFLLQCELNLFYAGRSTATYHTTVENYGTTQATELHFANFSQGRFGFFLL